MSQCVEAILVSCDCSVLPFTIDSLSELRMFQYQITAAGKTKLFHLSQSSDDFCDALNYAVWATRKEEFIGGGTLI